MKLLSHERLDALKEQLDYLRRMYSFHLAAFEKAYHEGPEFYAEENLDPAPGLLHAKWNQAGLVEATTRIEMEIKFLEDFLA
jgi:hypothetical protein